MLKLNITILKKTSKLEPTLDYVLSKEILETCYISSKKIAKTCC